MMLILVVASCGVVLQMPLTLRWSAMFNSSHLLVWLWMLQFQLCLNSQQLYILEGDRTISSHQLRYLRFIPRHLNKFLRLWRLKRLPHHLFMLSTMTVMKRCRVLTRYVLMGLSIAYFLPSASGQCRRSIAVTGVDCNVPIFFGWVKNCHCRDLTVMQ